MIKKLKAEFHAIHVPTFRHLLKETGFVLFTCAIAATIIAAITYGVTELVTIMI